MQSPTKQLLAAVFENDSTLSTQERRIINHLLRGTPLPSTTTADDKRLISAKDACRRLGCGKTRFYELRTLHPELAPTSELGSVRYRLDWILALLDRVGQTALSAHSQKGGVSCLSN